ncbi:MAG: hypothetical protein ACR2IF_07650 [Terriglobales bacterium]
MDNLKKSLLVVTVLAGLGIAMNLAGTGSQLQASAAAPVTVTNIPLPVSAAQSGSWTVSVGNTPNVNIANTPAVTLAPGASVRDADNPVRQPIVGEINGTDGASDQFSCSSTDDGCTVALFQVPAGKAFVLEYASMNACLTVGEVASMTINKTTANGCSAAGSTQCSSTKKYFAGISPAAIATDAAASCVSSGWTRVAQPMRVYFSAGEWVVAEGSRNKGETGSGGYSFGVSGYLVDVP